MALDDHALACTGAFLSAINSSDTSASTASPKTPMKRHAGLRLQKRANALASAEVTGFSGENKNAILSWFKANGATDERFPFPRRRRQPADSNSDTAGGDLFPSFSQFRCKHRRTDWAIDAVPGFAPSLSTMLNNFGGSYTKAVTAYGGLEAIVTTPQGKKATLYLADAFDDTCVRTPSSLDVVYNSFLSTYGKETVNKDDAVKEAAWHFTGATNERYKYKGLGSAGL
ncbi:hypothetical protein JCM21900_004184 [Sporobolomyces salmonicolor]